MSRYKALDRVSDEILDFESSTLTDTQTPRVPGRVAILWFLAGVIFSISTTTAMAIGLRSVRHDGVRAELIPNFSLVEVEFNPEPRYANLTDMASRHLWHELVHHGHVFVQDAARLGMKPGIPVSDDGGERIIVSGFHGLHCLRSIRDEVTELLLGHPTRTIHDYHDHPAHLDHCFDYLRQLLMCDLEITYEGARVDPDGMSRAVDGWGTLHQCKDWSAINSWMLENWNKERESSGWHPPHHDVPVQEPNATDTQPRGNRGKPREDFTM